MKKKKIIKKALKYAIKHNYMDMQHGISELMTKFHIHMTKLEKEETSTHEQQDDRSSENCAEYEHSVR